VKRSCVRGLAITIAAFLTFSGALLLEAQQPRSAVFTTEQAEAGRMAYAKHCASCHMPDLSGDNERPPLLGTGFITTWGGRSTKEFLAYMTGAMPYGAPALDAETYASLTAYILQSNGASAGGQALSASTDVSIGSVTAKLPASTISGRD
jgi:mono/diheme cytochrome c family protein